MNKPSQVAAHLNANHAECPSDYKLTAAAIAVQINVGLYWIGTASPGGGLPQAEVWQINVKGDWIRKLGTVSLGYDNIWRA